MRAGWAVLIVLLTAAASPARQSPQTYLPVPPVPPHGVQAAAGARPASHTAKAIALAGTAIHLPVPPMPPAHPPLGQSAPVPDPDITGPLAAAPTGPQFDISNFRVRNYDRSLGYAPGSQFQTSEDKRPIQTPGLTLRVPLQ